jgi:ABC-type glutathione transport system ATPase component
MPTESRLIEIRNLKVRFDSEGRSSTAVDDISFHVDRGEILAVVGESGSGKSATALSIMRLLPRAGRVVNGAINFKGRDLLTLSEREMRSIRGGDISMIFQEPMTSLNPLFTVGHQIGEAIVVHQGVSRAAARKLALDLLEAVEITDPHRRIDNFPHQMSGGQRQRVMIAMALASKPSLIIADEPTTALDVIIQAQILDLLKRLQAEIGAGVLFITHDLGVVAEIADRAVVMQNGRIVEQGAVVDIFGRPKDSYTRRLLDAVPRIDAAKVAPAAKTDTGVLLDVRNLSKWFPAEKSFGAKSGIVVKAVNNISLSIRRGEVLGLVGESGSGKTTVGRSILRLIEPTAGRIDFDGTDVTTLSRRELRLFRRRMQIIFQDPYGSLNPRWTVRRMLLEPLKVYGLYATRKERDQRVAMLLELVQLDPAWASRYPHEFSGGQRQRIGIARSLAVEPSFIVADECVSALDVSVRREVLNLIKDLRSRLGLTMLFISHDLAVVEDISDRVAVMYKGELVEISSAHELYRNPSDDYTKALLAAAPIPDPTVKRERVRWDAAAYAASRSSAA